MSLSKSSPLIYTILVLMLVALLGFSTLPLVTSVVQANQPTEGVTTSTDKQLEAEAQGYQLVLNREPDNQAALRGLLEVRLQQGNIAGTIYPLERLAQLNSDQIEYSILLAQAKEQIDDFSGAETSYRDILASHPGSMRALQGMVNLLLNQNQPEIAIEVVQNILTNAPSLNANQPDSVDITSIELLLGEIYATQKRYSEAIAIYDQIIDTEKNDFRPILSKALIFQEQEKYDDALPLFDSALALAPAKYQAQIKQMASDTFTSIKPSSGD